MAYSMVIADDELMMRNGLTGIIDWSKLGYRVDAVFSDGGEVIDYLRENVPDVLLSDIRMSRISGLDVTSFITEHHLPTKVVLISGYKDFEYARQALANNVEHYLLKPVSVPQLREVFTALREKLERQDAVDNALQHRLDRYAQMLQLQRRQLFLEAVMGALSGTDFERRLALAEIEGEAQNRPLLLFDLFLEQGEAYQRLVAELGTQELEEQLIHLLESFDQRLEFYPLECRPDRMLCLFREGEAGAGLLEHLAGPELEDMIRRLLSLLSGVHVRVDGLQYVESLHRLPGIRTKNLTFQDEEATSDYFHRVNETKKLVLSYLQDGDPQALSYCDSLVELVWQMGPGATQSHLFHLFTVVAAKVTGEEPQALSRLMTSLSVESASSFGDMQALKQWAGSRIEILLDYLHREKSRSGGGKSTWVSAIQRYVRESYATDISLRAAAELVYLNPIYVSRVFRETTGLTFTEYLSQVRIEKAVELLRGTDQYVYEISQSVGYQDIKYFYKVFRKLQGCSPSEYRSRCGAGERELPPGGAPRLPR